MIRTYRYRLYPTEEQESTLSEILDIGRWLYNHALAYRRKRWRDSRYSVTYNEQSSMWSAWRNEDPDNNPLRLLNMSAGQQVLRRLDKAYREFFKGKRGKPRFKNHRAFNSLNYKHGDGAGIKENRLYIQNVGLMNIKWHRPLIEGKLKNIIILRKASGWYVLLQVKIEFEAPDPSPNPAVGIDVGLTHALALSDGTMFDAPPFLRDALKKLRVLQRRVARRKKGSKRREKAIHQLQKHMEHIANQRRDWWHKVCYWLTKHYGAIGLENLNLRFMLQNKHLARAAYDVGLGIFYEILDYKAMDAGVQLVKVPAYNTSQLCSGCGRKVPKALLVRVHKCPHCDIELDRDVNAAINIMQRAFP